MCSNSNITLNAVIKQHYLNQITLRKGKKKNFFF